MFLSISDGDQFLMLKKMNIQKTQETNKFYFDDFLLNDLRMAIKRNSKIKITQYYNMIHESTRMIKIVDACLSFDEIPVLVMDIKILKNGAEESDLIVLPIGGVSNTRMTDNQQKYYISFTTISDQPMVTMIFPEQEGTID